MTRAAFLSLRRCTRGATAVEFALLAPAFFGMIFATIEGTRYIWMKQSLSEVAFSAARCQSVSSSCGDAAGAKAYAAERAQSYLVAVSAADVTAERDVTCNGIGHSNKVVIEVPYRSALRGFIPGIPATIGATACFASLD